MHSIYPVTCHTDHVGPGTTFVVIKGTNQDGLQFVFEAVRRGATRIIVAQDAIITPVLKQLFSENNIVCEYVANTRKALALESAQAAGNPAKKLKIVGITGTKGKTTTAFLLFHMLCENGYKSALLSTVENRINEDVFPAPLTTPQPDYLQQFLKQCVDRGVTHVVMEVAAHAVTLHRIEGILFDAIIMTNIAREHLEFYDSMNAYAQAKYDLLLYRKSDARAWLNRDDKCLAMRNDANTQFFGMKDTAALQGTLIPSKPFVLHMRVAYKNKQYMVKCPHLCGTYNGLNVLAACGAALTVGLSLESATNVLSTFKGVSGRLNRYALPNGAQAIIDYAHNPYSYEALLRTMRTISDHVIVVFGAGGERDKGRRPQMGCIAAQYADVVIITSDNPRSEDPALIAQDIISEIGSDAMRRITIELDRKKALLRAYKASHDGSCIVILGKGQEEYQIIGSEKLFFSDRQIIEQLGLSHSF